MPDVIDPDEYFDDEMSSHYDHFVRLLVPDYERIHEFMVAQLGLALDDESRVLVVGAGTCNEILQLAHFDPHWRFTAVEPAAAMVAAGKERVADAGITGNVAFHTGTLDTLEDQGPFDAATAILMMQFLDEAGKGALFKEIAKRLKPGAPLVMAHPIGDPQSDEFVMNMGAWREHFDVTMPEQAEEMYDKVQDTLFFISEERQAALLRDAGFGDPVRFHSRTVFGAWIVNKL